MNIIDFGDMSRRKDVGGFYIVAQCPECHAPIYLHGGGKANGEEQGEIPLPSCLCMSEMPFEMAIPVQYEFEIERNAILHLFREYYTLLRELRDVGTTDEGTADESGSGSISTNGNQDQG